MGRIRNRLTGQIMMKARPTTALSGIVPPPGSPMWSRESADQNRLSPMTHSRPGGTTMLNRDSEGAEPGYRYDCSFSGTPLTVTRPCASQQATRSPGIPMTRLMRMSPGVPKPNMLAKPLANCWKIFPATGTVPGSQEPSPLKTTMSPR